MASNERVTITLPAELLEHIDRLERNRSRFIKEAVAHELTRRRRDGLLRSLEHPHSEAAELSDVGLGEWAASMPEDEEGLVDMATGTAVRWVDGEGWVEEPR